MSPPPQAPPTRAGSITSTRRVVWPGAFGMLCMILGGLGILYGLVQLAMPFLIAAMESLEPRIEASVEGMKQNAPYTFTIHAIGVLAAGLLLFGGLRLFARRRSGIRLVIAWSLIRFPWIVGVLFVTHRVQTAQQEFMRAQSGPGLPGAFASALMPFFNNIGLVFVAAWYLWLPVLLLAWLLRPSIRAQAASWKP